MSTDRHTHLLHLEDVYKWYGEKLVLENVDLALAQSTFCSVVGPSGCGKSTLFRILLGQEPPSSGQVLLAFRTPAAIERYLERPMERFTDRTLADAEAVRERLREVRRRGYAWALEEFDADISSIAAPIADASGEVIAAVHVHGPSYRFPAEGSEADLAQLVLAGAARIAAGLRET